MAAAQLCEKLSNRDDARSLKSLKRQHVAGRDLLNDHLILQLTFATRNGPATT
jgi:hypothetical protein